MTRLQSCDIVDIPLNIKVFDDELKSKTGHSLRQLACKAVGIGVTAADTIRTDCSVSVIPTTCGQGVIGGFSETISKIAGHLGFLSEVTLSTDVAGLAEAIEKETDIVLMADDQRFIAIHLPTGCLADNSAATGKGFVTGLELMAGKLKGRRVLVPARSAEVLSKPYCCEELKCRYTTLTGNCALTWLATCKTSITRISISRKT
jgi:pyrrolysine biosynthesis protein PylD